VIEESTTKLDVVKEIFEWVATKKDTKKNSQI
jgi:hypothetical protein